MIARTTSVWKACASIVCLLTLLLASFSCGGTNEVETGTVEGVEQEVRPPPRCAPASSIQMEYVRSGIKGVQVSNNVRQGMAVKSNEFEKAYFVSAKIYGPGIEDGEGPGVWFITGDKTSPGMIFSVNSYAKLYSDFPDASTTKADATMSDDGAMEARNCAEELVEKALSVKNMVTATPYAKLFGASPTPTPTPKLSCTAASDQQMSYIRSRVKVVGSSNNVRRGIAVESRYQLLAHSKSYFVSAKIYGPGIEDGQGPGVWFITGDKTSPGMIFSVNSYAKLYSDFPDVSTMEWNVIMDDEAIEARNCAE